MTYLLCYPQSSGNLVSLVHNDIDVGDEDSLKLTNVLSHQADILIQIEGLNSGFSKDVHGQVCTNAVFSVLCQKKDQTMCKASLLEWIAEVL